MKDFCGYFTALVTPFLNGVIDLKSLEHMLERQIEAGVNGIVVSGTTGEDSALSQEEKILLIREVYNIVQNRVRVVVGCSGNNTYEIIKKIDILLNSNISNSNLDTFLISSPYYNRPTQEGVFQHYKKIADEYPNIKVIIYNVPSRSGINISVEVLNMLADCNKNIIAVKDSVTDISRIYKITLPVFTGEDFYALAAMVYGAVGCISVASNIVPYDCMELYNSFISGNIKNSIRINKKLSLLNELLFIESNPIPLKYILYIVNLIASPELRLPLTTLSEEYRDNISNICKELVCY